VEGAPLITERVWGKALLAQFAPLGLTRQNSFEVIEWKLGAGDDQFPGQNSYYEFFNHGGPHVDAPKHVSLGGGLESYPIEVFSGRAKVFDVRGYRNGRSIRWECSKSLCRQATWFSCFPGMYDLKRKRQLPSSLLCL